MWFSIKLWQLKIRFLCLVSFGLKVLFSKYLTSSKILCDAYVIENLNFICKSLKINVFLCDAYVIAKMILFNDLLIKLKLEKIETKVKT